MKCFYCSTFQRAKNITETREDAKKIIPGKKFCPNIRKVVQEFDELCEFFEPTSYFWCSNLEQRLDIPTCQAKQERGECSKCRQKNDIMEIRKFLGRKKAIAKGKIIVKRKESECPEITTPVKKNLIIKRNILA